MSGRGWSSVIQAHALELFDRVNALAAALTEAGIGGAACRAAARKRRSSGEALGVEPRRAAFLRACGPRSVE